MTDDVIFNDDCDIIKEIGKEVAGFNEFVTDDDRDVIEDNFGDEVVEDSDGIGDLVSGGD